MHAFATGSRTAVYGYLAVLAVVIALILNRAMDATNFDYPWLISAPSVGAAFAALLAIFDGWAWRWRWLRAVGISTTPVVDSTYEGTIRSTYGSAVINVRSASNSDGCGSSSGSRSLARAPPRPALSQPPSPTKATTTHASHTRTRTGSGPESLRRT